MYTCIYLGLVWCKWMAAILSFTVRRQPMGNPIEATRNPIQEIQEKRRKQFNLLTSFNLLT